VALHQTPTLHHQNPIKHKSIKDPFICISSNTHSNNGYESKKAKKMDYGVTAVWGAKAKSTGVAGFLPGDDRQGLPEIEDEAEMTCRVCRK
jgi:hypothetical protein